MIKHRIQKQFQTAFAYTSLTIFAGIMQFALTFGEPLKNYLIYNVKLTI